MPGCDEEGVGVSSSATVRAYKRCSRSCCWASSDSCCDCCSAWRWEMSLRIDRGEGGAGGGTSVLGLAAQEVIRWGVGSRERPKGDVQ